MLREINIGARSNEGARQLTQSAIQSEMRPQPTQLLSESDQARQPDTDLRVAGVKSGQSVLDNFQIDLRA
ncbi:MAG: hypothetical protein KDK30_06340 [Leptospiraceae bacterium]|nr:hypothetical protein [Leptospiraceae bacterium]